MLTGRVSYADLARGDGKIPPFEDRQLLEQLDKHGTSGVRAFHLALTLRPEETAVVLRRARELRVATLGELAKTTYADALGQGLQALLHTTRFTLALMPEPGARRNGC